MGKQCGVCKDAESKYKCPTCSTPYVVVGVSFAAALSVATRNLKKHHVQSRMRMETKLIKVEEQPAASVAEDDESNNRLKHSQLEAVAASEEIRKMLRDRELQELISKIDSSPHSNVELEKATEGPAFREFTDKVLRTSSRSVLLPQLLSVETQRSSCCP